MEMSADFAKFSLCSPSSRYIAAPLSFDACDGGPESIVSEHVCMIRIDSNLMFMTLLNKLFATYGLSCELFHIFFWKISAQDATLVNH